MFRKLASYFRSLATKLLELHDNPTSLAGGVAIGMFVGFTPLFGVKTLICLGLAYLFRCNPIAAVLAVTLHDVVTPVWPIILDVEYAIGYWFLSYFHKLSAPEHLHEFHLREMLKWTTFMGMGLPLLAGSLFLSTPAAFLSYAIMLPVFRRRANRRSVAEEQADSP